MNKLLAKAGLVVCLGMVMAGCASVGEEAKRADASAAGLAASAGALSSTTSGTGKDLQDIGIQHSASYDIYVQQKKDAGKKITQKASAKITDFRKFADTAISSAKADAEKVGKGVTSFLDGDGEGVADSRAAKPSPAKAGRPPKN